jgi:heavy metal sensor kinase
MKNIGAQNWFQRSASNLMVFFGSIRFRLTLWTAAILSLILLVFSIFIYSRQSYDLQLRAQTQLQLKTQQIEALYRLTGTEEGDAEHPNIPDLTAQKNPTLTEHEVLALVRPDGQTLQKVGSFDDAAISQLFNAWQQKTGSSPIPAIFSTSIIERGEHSSNTNYVALITPLFAEKKMVGLIILGQPLDPNEELPRQLLTLMLGSIATIAFALIGGYWLASRAMAPVRTITRTARGISETDLNKRLRLGKRDELGELANTFDSMLDRLQAAFDRQRQFTADASHELRTPLTIVNLEAEQALARPRSVEEYERVLKVIRSENDFMAHLVNDLLTLARMDAGQTRLHLEMLDLSDLALEAVERLTNLARRSEVELTLQELPETRVLADRQYLSQAISNLVENAVKYAGGRGKHVYIETGMRLINTQQWAWIRVEDDGPGIPNDHLSHLFDRFYRVDKARTRSQDETNEANPATNPDGSGLGLSIVQWIAAAHNGKVRVKSQVGEGTAFEIELPAAARTGNE